MSGGWRRCGRPSNLIELATAHPGAAAQIASRPWLAEAVDQGQEAVGQRLQEEERRIRAEDRAYWQPLRQELEQMRLRR